MSNDFAKLYHKDNGDQVLVRKDMVDGEPVIVIETETDSGLIAVTFNFQGTDAGWDERDEAFTAVTKEQALGVFAKDF